MKRKTNLFYLSGDDANFLTFSNYTESLTGTILSTDTKIFPSRFICFNITANDLDNAKLIIRQYLVKYYENKLAVLRDYYLKNNKNPENYIKPLPYLLKTFELINSNEEINIEPVYVGQISEQDYNGTYSDMILTIDSSSLKNVEIIKAQENENELNDENNISIEDEIDKTYLYGWYSENEEVLNIPSEYMEYHPIFDDEENKKYFIDTDINSISYGNSNEGNIEFDLVVPLYDIVDINYQTNIIEQDENISKSINFKETDKDSDLYNYNVPYGIWFSSDKIVLKRDNENKVGQSWSLVLSSQFKPFPNTNNMPNEIDENKIPEAYCTLAQVLSRQNEILEEFNKINNSLININNRLTKLEGKVNTIGTSYTMDDIYRNFINWEKTMEDKYSYIIEDVNSTLDNFKWKFND